MNKIIPALILISTTLAASLPACAEDRFASVEIKTVPVAGNVSALFGSGGNIGVSAGDDGILMVDDQYLPLSKKIKVALAALGDDSPKWLLNTHYHGDHTGGNPAFGPDSIIMAHDNVRLRLVGGDMPKSALPIVTYSDMASIHFNGEEIRLMHLPSGHTDGDTIVFFTGSGVVHMGDHFFNGLFPFVDLDGGGSVRGLTANIAVVLDEIDDDIKIIPGHGPLATKADLEGYHDMLIETTATVQRHIDAGRTMDEIVSAGLDKKWASWNWQFIDESRWIQTIYAELTK